MTKEDDKTPSDVQSQGGGGKEGRHEETVVSTGSESQQPHQQQGSSDEGSSLSEVPQTTSNVDTRRNPAPNIQSDEDPKKESTTTSTAWSDGNRFWVYLDGVSPAQHGPYSESVMLKLLRRGTANKDLMAWSQGMGEWQELGQIEAFREIAELASTPWLYLGENSEQEGPVTAAALSQLFSQGHVDGMTMAWTTGMVEWKHLGEVAQLRVLLQGDDEEDEEDDNDDRVSDHDRKETNGAVGTGGATEADPGMMVFEAEEEAQPAYEPPPRKEVGEKKSKRSFMADDGTKFAWDEERGDWKQVEGDEEDELEEDEEEEEEEPSWKIRRAKQLTRAKAKQSAGSKAKQAADIGVDPDDPDTAHWGELLEDAKRDDAAGEGGGDGVAAPAGENGTGGDGEESSAQKKNKKKSSKRKKTNQWNKKAVNLWVYVKGLPLDVTMEEIKEHFGKCGIIATDPLTQQPKIKLYKDEEGQLKGDGSVCYVKMESVEMAINVLHEGQIRPGVTIEVSRAVFQQKGNSFDTSKRLKVNDARVKVARAAAQQALSWAESDDTGSTKGGLKIVVVENMFQPSDFETNETFGEELEADLLAEGEKLGPVEKITVFPKNTKGPVVIKFGTVYGASECIKAFDGRFFGGRKLSCHFWDGVTNYTVKKAEDDKEDEERLKEFGDWLEDQELPEELRPRTEG